MKKIYSLFGIFTFAVLAGFSQPASWQTVPDPNNVPPKRVYTVKTISDFDYLSSTVADLWATISNMDTLTNHLALTDDDGNPTTRMPDGPGDLTVYMKSVWDADNLYIAFKVIDDYIAEASDTIQDAFEIMYATYPNYWPAVYDTATTDAAKSPAFARWDTTGSRKTGNWLLQNNPSVVYDDYRPTWDFVNWGPSATPWVVGWGSSADAFNFDAVYEKINDTSYYYLAVIPWADAMAGFVPSADTAISMELKLVDKDPGKLVIQATWDSDNNDSYWTTYYSGIFDLDSTDVTGKSGIYKDADNILLYPNPATNFIQIKNVNHVKKVVILNILGQEVKTFDNVSGRMEISDLKSGMYIMNMYLKDNQVAVKNFLKK